MSFTVLGAGGFIGRNLAEQLKAAGESVVGLTRDDMARYGASMLQLDFGHLIYCIGVTADFRLRPYDTVQAHVCMLRPLLEHARFDSFTYLSSTRVYAGSGITHEDQGLTVRPADPDQLYELSKLTGESLCLSSGRNARVVRLSNVYGLDFEASNFLTQVLSDAAHHRRVVLRSAPASEKDYVALQDVLGWLPQIAVRGKHKIYNLASGRNVSNAEIAEHLRQCRVEVEFAADAPVRSFPPIDSARVGAEFNAANRHLLQDLPGLLVAFQSHLRTRMAEGDTAAATAINANDSKEQP